MLGGHEHESAASPDLTIVGDSHGRVVMLVHLLRLGKLLLHRLHE